MKNTLIIIAMFFSSLLCVAQNQITPTGTVTDSDAQVWANASITFYLVHPGSGNPVYSSNLQPVPLSCTAQLTSGGVFTTVTCPSTTGLPNNAAILPANTTWRITICSATSAPCQTLTPIYVTPANTNLGLVISGLISAPRIQAAPTRYAYNTTEIINQTNGDGYTNTVSAVSYLWNGSWTQIGGASGGLTSFQGRTAPAATLQASDLVSTFPNSPYNLVNSNCGVGYQSSILQYNGTGSFKCNNYVETGLYFLALESPDSDNDYVFLCAKCSSYGDGGVVNLLSYTGQYYTIDSNAPTTLSDGFTATTQDYGDVSTLLATDQFVDNDILGGAVTVANFSINQTCAGGVGTLVTPATITNVAGTDSNHTFKLTFGSGTVAPTGNCIAVTMTYTNPKNHVSFPVIGSLIDLTNEQFDVACAFAGDCNNTKYSIRALSSIPSSTVTYPQVIAP